MNPNELETHILDVLSATSVALRRDLLAQGWSDKLLRRRLADGSMVRLRHGSFVDATMWQELDARARHELLSRSVAARAGTPVVVSHASALCHWRTPDWGLDLTDVHVTRRDGRTGRAEAGVRQHRGRLDEDDVRLVRGTEVCSPERALLELGTVAGTEPTLVQANDLLHRGLVTPQSLRARYGQGVERWPGSLGIDVVLRLADGRCESVAESRFFHLCWRFGLPRPTPQLKIFTEGGRLLARLDFAWPELGVWVEIDGLVKYVKYLAPGETVTDVVLREKKREDDVRRLTDMRCLRVIWSDLERPAQTARTVERFLQPPARPSDGGVDRVRPVA